MTCPSQRWMDVGAGYLPTYTSLATALATNPKFIFFEFALGQVDRYLLPLGGIYSSTRTYPVLLNFAYLHTYILIVCTSPALLSELSSTYSLGRIHVHTYVHRDLTYIFDVYPGRQELKVPTQSVHGFRPSVLFLLSSFSFLSFFIASLYTTSI